MSGSCPASVTLDPNSKLRRQKDSLWPVPVSQFPLRAGGGWRKYPSYFSTTTPPNWVERHSTRAWPGKKSLFWANRNSLIFNLLISPENHLTSPLQKNIKEFAIYPIRKAGDRYGKRRLSASPKNFTSPNKVPAWRLEKTVSSNPNQGG